MDEMIRYIFGSLRSSEATMSIIAKMLRKQKSFNRSVSIFAVISTLHIIAQGMEIHSMHCEIENLKSEIKELKKTEGD